MKTLEVTKLEAEVLTALANEMYAERGFSDVGFDEIKDKVSMSMKTLKGVAGSLEKKNLIEVDRRESEGYENNSKMWIWYLTGGAEGLVKHWGEEDVKLIIK